MRRLLAAAASAALLAAGVVFPTAPAAADGVDRCTTSTGVLVVVDLRPFGGNVARGCDATPTDGYDALHEAGFTTEGTQHDGPAFICRINGKPTKDRESCVRTPPPSAYWSYWHANAGQKSWSYSTMGAMSSKPPAGSVDAWVFGSTDVGGTTGQPCFSPADARAGRATPCSTSAPRAPTRGTKKSTPKPTRQRSAAGAPAATAPRTSAAAAGTAASDPAPGTRSTSSAPATPASGTPSTTATTATSPGATSSAGAPAIVDASQAAGARNDSGGGSATPAILGLGLAVVLAAGAGITMLRRRRTDPEL